MIDFAYRDLGSALAALWLGLASVSNKMPQLSLVTLLARRRLGLEVSASILLGVLHELVTFSGTI